MVVQPMVNYVECESRPMVVDTPAGAPFASVALCNKDVPMGWFRKVNVKEHTTKAHLLPKLMQQLDDVYRGLNDLCYADVSPLQQSGQVHLLEHISHRMEECTALAHYIEERTAHQQMLQQANAAHTLLQQAS